MKKKMIAIIACLILVASLSLTLVACGATITDPDKVVEYITKAGDGKNYTIVTTMTMEGEEKPSVVTMTRENNKIRVNMVSGAESSDGVAVLDGEKSKGYAYDGETKKWAEESEVGQETVEQVFGMCDMTIKSLSTAFTPLLYKYDSELKVFKTKTESGVTFKIVNGDITMTTVVAGMTTVVEVKSIGKTKVSVPTIK